MVGSFFHYSTALLSEDERKKPENRWVEVFAREITLPPEQGGHDPMYVVVGTKGGFEGGSSAGSLL